MLPVKSLARAKHRLAPVFGPRDRGEIARALLEDALALCRAAGFLRWWVVSDDAEVLASARAAGLHAFAAPGAGLNPALAAAVEHVVAAGAASVTIVPVDVPLADPSDIADVVDTGATSDMVVVPSETDHGTNALYLSPPDLIPPRFGRDSLAAHLDAAERLSLRCSILALPRLALDIDTIDDVDEFLVRADASGRTAEVLARLRPSP